MDFELDECERCGINQSKLKKLYRTRSPQYNDPFNLQCKHCNDKREKLYSIFDKKIDEMKKKQEYHPIFYEGWPQCCRNGSVHCNTCTCGGESCRGWNGEDKRCECDNLRCQWVWEIYSNKDIYVEVY